MWCLSVVLPHEHVPCSNRYLEKFLSGKDSHMADVKVYRSPLGSRHSFNARATITTDMARNVKVLVTILIVTILVF